MTIYKTSPGEKKPNKDAEVATEPLTGFKDGIECSDEAVALGPRLVRVTYFPQRRRTWVNLCLTLTSLLILGTGAIAAIFLYRHLSNKVVKGRFGVSYRPEDLHQQQSDGLEADPSIYLEEDVEVSECDMYEKYTVPEFGEMKDTVVWHDFGRNLTAIVDPNLRVCYIMPLNRSRIAPPRDTIDLINKHKSGYYMPNASVIREQYRIVQPQLDDLTFLGYFIMSDCYWYDTFRLEKCTTATVHKRSADQTVQTTADDFVTYGYFTSRSGHTEIYETNIVKFKEVASVKDSGKPEVPPGDW